jgi:hypothetical protein
MTKDERYKETHRPSGLKGSLKEITSQPVGRGFSRWKTAF